LLQIVIELARIGFNVLEILTRNGLVFLCVKAFDELLPINMEIWGNWSLNLPILDALVLPRFHLDQRLGD
jgi:hypothetical protein